MPLDLCREPSRGRGMVNRGTCMRGSAAMQVRFWHTAARCTFDPDSQWFGYLSRSRGDHHGAWRLDEISRFTAEDKVYPHSFQTQTCLAEGKGGILMRHSVWRSTNRRRACIRVMCRQHSSVNSLSGAILPYTQAPVQIVLSPIDLILPLSSVLVYVRSRQSGDIDQPLPSFLNPIV